MATDAVPVAPGANPSVVNSNSFSCDSKATKPATVADQTAAASGSQPEGEQLLVG